MDDKADIYVNKKQIINNAGISVLQTVVSSVSMFVAYRYLLVWLGVDQLGIWSLVLASTSIYQIVNFGLSGSVIKYVAQYIARVEYENVSKVIQTATVSVTVVITVMLGLTFPVLQMILRKIVPADSLGLALDILPWAAAALMLLLISGVFQAGLDGCGRVDLRNWVIMGGALLHLILVLVLVPAFGLQGAAYAKVAQNGMVLLVAFFILRSRLPFLPRGIFRWNKQTFKEIIGYGSSFQAVAIFYTLYDPVTKGLLTRLGSLSLVGYYEMANKLIVLSNSLIVTANQVLIPTFAALKERAPEKVKPLYDVSYRLILYLSIPIYTLTLLYLPMISNIWIGKIERPFILFGSLLCIGYLLDNIIAPARTVYMGLGSLGWNVLGRGITALLNFILGYMLGVLYGGTGVVVGWVFGLSLGCIIILLSYYIKYNIPLKAILPRESAIFFILFSVSIVYNLIITGEKYNALLYINISLIITVIVSIIVVILTLVHPMRAQLLQWARMRL